MDIKTDSKCILLVDDDAICTLICKNLIKELGFQNTVETAKNGKLALHYLDLAIKESKPLPGLILLDINMPEMNGWEFLESFEKLPQNQFGNVKVVMVTSSISPFDIRKAENSSLIAEFITKPVNLETMAGILERHG